jgi:hypothetical protein
MTAPARRSDAAALSPVQSRTGPHGRPATAGDLALALTAWDKAVDIRREWLAHGLATGPADRNVAEGALSRIYGRLGRPRPGFIWVDSPGAAAPQLSGVPTHEELYHWVHGRQPPGKPPFASDLAASLSQLRSALDGHITPPAFDRPPAKLAKGDSWPVLPPDEAIRVGIPFPEVLRQGIRAALRTTMASLFLPVRAACLHNGPICWYGQQEAHWIAFYDAWRRLGLATYRGHEAEHFDDWATLARTAGWWWPAADVCVVAEPPEHVRVRPVSKSWHEEVRVCEVRYRDGWRPQLE